MPELIRLRRRGAWRKLLVGTSLLFLLSWSLLRGTTAPQASLSSSPVERDVETYLALAPVPRDQTFFHTYPDSNRYIAGDIWRPPDSYGTGINIAGVPPANPRVLQQRLAQEYAKNSENVFLLIKTGVRTIWERLPMHLLTTLTRLPNFAIYSDAADSIAGYEVIDILANVSETQLLHSPQLKTYRQIRAMRSKHNYIPASELDIKDGWVLDKFKPLKMLEHAYATVPHMDWFVVIDDDTILLADNLTRFLATLDPSKPYYLGSAVAGLDHVFAHGGSGIVLSRSLMERAFANPESKRWIDEYTKRAEAECCGDYILAAMLKEKLGVSLDYESSGGRFQGEPIFRVPASSSNWCQEIITMHKQSARDFELVWEYEKVRGTESPILYMDIYHDFIKPYFPSEPVAGWDNGSHDVEYSWADDDASPDSSGMDAAKPYASLDACRKECEQRSDCLMYRYDPYRRYCGISKSTVALGRPLKEYDDIGFRKDPRTRTLSIEPRSSEQQLTSGWFIDRIRSMRRQKQCDVLHNDPDADGKAFGVRDQVEGWWHRAKERYPDAFRDPLKEIYASL